MGTPSSDTTKAKISARKRGIPQSPAHLAARRAGRLPKFTRGDAVDWFGEVGEVAELLGIQSAYGDGRQAYWYRVVFGPCHRDLIQDVLTKV